MTTFVVTLPGTFEESLTEDARSRLVEGLKPAEPDALSVDTESSTFTIRLEIEADDPKEAERNAQDIAARALLDAGYTIMTAPMGEPVTTGVEVG
ncbi:hypothetical protein V2J94_41450 [Streptomyces sp. DSM 41524]|uniref:Mucin n=1 Tax=Streptomyces asiaticus subsp. ignotus TaxID=3098222 RepID=A0ABU7QA31_9ACTN|nr:hypothetical protein [Streptomyces sp. DSM 41524]